MRTRRVDGFIVWNRLNVNKNVLNIENICEWMQTVDEKVEKSKTPPGDEYVYRCKTIFQIETEIHSSTNRLCSVFSTIFFSFYIKCKRITGVCEHQDWIGKQKKKIDEAFQREQYDFISVIYFLCYFLAPFFHRYELFVWCIRNGRFEWETNVN